MITPWSPVLAQQEVETTSSTVSGLDWVVAAGIICGAILVARAAQSIVVRFLRRGDKTASFSEVLVGRFIAIIISLIGLSYALSVLDVQIGPLLGALGIGGLAVALALQPTLQNLFAGVVLEAQRPFRRGDEVETNGHVGIIDDITSRATVIVTLDGQRVYLPNTLVLENAIVNRVSEVHRRSSVFVGVAYGTDLGLAQRTLSGAAARVEGVLEVPEPRVWAVEFGESSIDFEMTVWHRSDDHSRRVAVDSTVHAVEAALHDAGITIPFPQRTLWHNPASPDPVPPDPVPPDPDSASASEPPSS